VPDRYARLPQSLSPAVAHRAGASALGRESSDAINDLDEPVAAI